MKILTKIAAAALIGTGACLNVSAGFLTGSISMSTTPPSTWTGDGGNVLTIASISSFGASTVDSATGDFAPNLGSPVTWGPTPLVFAAPAGSNPLWTTVPGFKFIIDAAPLLVNRINNPFPIPDSLSLAGSGTLTAPGFDPTPGGWTWTGTM